MIVSLRDRLSKLCRAPPDRRPPRRARLGFYGYRYRKARRRSVTIARGAVAAALAIATIAAASGQLSR
jgi:hypothetical protein